MKGYIQIYTGNGKGKTTAAIGLAIRAVGANLKVFIGQFVKGIEYSELKSLKRFYPKIVVKQFGRKCFIHKAPTKKDIKLARQGFHEIKRAIKSGKYNLVILDEANIAIHYGLIPVDDFLKLIDEKPKHVELVFTGRKAPRKLVKRADLVTEMKKIKHYYTRGVTARDGIEK